MKHTGDAASRRSAAANMRVSPTKPASSPRKLVGSLGPIAITFMVVAAAAPLQTVGAVVPIGLLNGNGEGYPFAYAIVAVILALFAVGFTGMTRYVKNTGAFYSYVTEGLGRAWGLGAAFIALVTYMCLQAAVFAFLGVVFQELVTDYGGPDVPWWVWTIIFVGVIGFLGYRNIDLSSKVLGVILIAELIVMAGLIAAVALLGGGPEGNLTSVTPLDFFAGSPALAVMFAFTGFVGFEATAIYRDESRDPASTIPKATYGALLVIAIAYALSAWAMISAWSKNGAEVRAEESPQTMLMDTFSLIFGGWSAQVVQVLIVGSAIACVLSFHNLIARYLFVLSNTGALPRTLGRAHPVFNSPYAASLVQTVGVAILLGFLVLLNLDPIAQILTWLAAVGAVGFLALLLMTCLAVLIYFRRHDLKVGRWKAVVAPSIALGSILIALILTLWNLPLLTESGPVAIAVVAGLVVALVAGLVLAKMNPSANRLPADDASPSQAAGTR